MTLRGADILASAAPALRAAVAPALRLGVALALCGGAAWAQTAALQPLTLDAIAPVLARPVGEGARAARTSGAIDLKGRRAYIAEYLLLWELSGEVSVTPRDGQVLGFPVGQGPVTLAWRSSPDIAALQALTDRAWAVLQARLAAAGVMLADAAEVVREHGAVYPATEAGSAPGAPVVLEARSGGRPRRYLMLSPIGMRLVQRSASGVGVGNLAARLAYPAQGVEGLSLALAVHLSTLDPTGARPDAFAVPGSPPALSPLMEVVPAPAAALVHAHAQMKGVELADALVPAAAFGRLRLAPMDGPIPSNDPLGALRSLGRRVAGGEAEAPRLDALLELDGPATARGVLSALRVSNQAIAEALRVAR